MIIKGIKEEHRKKLLSLARILLAVGILALILFFIPLPYMFECPGSADETSRYIHVENGKNKRSFSTGKFYITTVIYERANIILFLYGLINPSRVELTPVESQTLRNNTKRNKIMAQHMEDSKIKSQIAAFKILGYPVKIKRSPVEIVDIIDESKAKGILKEKDQILKINGIPLNTEEEMIDLVREWDFNRPLPLTIKRDQKELEVKIPLIKRGNRQIVGVQISSRIEDIQLPLKIKSDSHNVIGSSAGLMFSLEIIRQISGKDITGGHKIAGTGTIDEEGKVYPIQGVRFKVMAAEDEGAEYFFVPEKNYQEAKEQAKKIKLLSVSNLQDALDHLKTINPSSDIDKIKEENRKKALLPAP